MPTPCWPSWRNDLAGCCLGVVVAGAVPSRAGPTSGVSARGVGPDNTAVEVGDYTGGEEVIDLKQTYGKRYKIEIDPSWDAETTANRTWFRQHGEEPYYYELIGKHGRLYNHSDTHMQMLITSRLGANLRRNLPEGWKTHQRASDGCTFILPNSDVSIAFKWIKPRKRRQGPKDTSHLRAYHFKKKSENNVTQNSSGVET